MLKPAAPSAPIPPVFVLGSGRCGSTMLSDILNCHPRVLSLSELFSSVGMGVFRFRRVTGRRMWDAYSRQSARSRLLLRGDSDEVLYPFDAPGARFGRHDVPPVMGVALPHLGARAEALFDEMEPVVLGQPRQPPAAHFRHLFEWLCRRLDRSVWVERSGGSLMFGYRLVDEFPDARIIHVYRDGRDVAISMSRHYVFRTVVATILALRRWGVDVNASMARGRRWDNAGLWLEALTSRFFDPGRLPYDRLTLADFAAFWNAMIERAHRMFGHFPPERVLHVRFEEVLADPEARIGRIIRFISPDLEDEAWLREAARIPRPARSRFRQLGAEEQALLTEGCRPGLERLGYPL